CLSPSVAYLEASGAIQPEDFGERVARAQARWAEQWPVRPPSDAQASATHQARGTCELAGGRVWVSADTSWTVALDRREPPVAPACVRCGAVSGGGMRVAIWEEEEKGRLGARPLPVCTACHAAFLAGEVPRVDFARAYHEARGVHPHGWIGRIDRDLLLDVV